MALNIYTDASHQEQQLAPFCKTILGLANNFSHFGSYALAHDNPNLGLTFKTQPLDDLSLTDSIQLQAYEHESGTLEIELSFLDSESGGR